MYHTNVSLFLSHPFQARGSPAVGHGLSGLEKAGSCLVLIHSGDGGLRSLGTSGARAEGQRFCWGAEHKLLLKQLLRVWAHSSNAPEHLCPECMTHGSVPAHPHWRQVPPPPLPSLKFSPHGEGPHQVCSGEKFHTSFSSKTEFCKNS